MFVLGFKFSGPVELFLLILLRYTQVGAQFFDCMNKQLLLLFLLKGDFDGELRKFCFYMCVAMTEVFCH